MNIIFLEMMTLKKKDLAIHFRERQSMSRERSIVGGRGRKNLKQTPC